MKSPEDRDPYIVYFVELPNQIENLISSTLIITSLTETLIPKRLQ